MLEMGLSGAQKLLSQDVVGAAYSMHSVLALSADKKRSKLFFRNKDTGNNDLK